MKELLSNLPCDGFNVSFDNFCLETSPCRKCNLEICPFDELLGKLDKDIGNLYEHLGMERVEK